MNNKKHQKHTKLIRPNLGEFGRNETAIVGAPCGVIKDLAYAILGHLGDKYKIAYVDADHASFDNPQKTKELANGAFISFTDHNVFERIDYAEQSDKFERNRRFNAADFVLINGNHFTAHKQVVIIHPKKADSLLRKREKLTNVELILLADGVQVVPTWLTEDLDKQTEEVPVISLQNQAAIFAFFAKKLHSGIAPLLGLVLAGGKSQRMGQDKGAIEYHGKAQREYAFDLLNTVCNKTYLSGRADQVKEWEAHFPVIKDTFTGLGPYGAILSAFRENPNAAWLCVACDLPLLDQKTLQILANERDPAQNATAFHNTETSFPEPLITIWEPKSYATLLHFLSLGYSCPRKVLINSPIKTVRLSDEKVLLNVNTEQERQDLIKNQIIL